MAEQTTGAGFYVDVFLSGPGFVTLSGSGDFEHHDFLSKCTRSSAGLPARGRSPQVLSHLRGISCQHSAQTRRATVTSLQSSTSCSLLGSSGGTDPRRLHTENTSCCFHLCTLRAGEQTPRWLDLCGAFAVGRWLLSWSRLWGGGGQVSAFLVSGALLRPFLCWETTCRKWCAQEVPVLPTLTMSHPEFFFFSGRGGFIVEIP